MTRAQLEAAHKTLKYPMPAEGRGANKGLVKIDYARAITKHLRPDSSKEEFERMVDGIMGGVKPKVRCPAAVLAALKGLSAEEKDGFEELEMIVANQEKEQQKEKQERKPSERPDAYAHLHSTHPAVRGLVPNSPRVWLQSQPRVEALLCLGAS